MSNAEIVATALGEMLNCSTYRNDSPEYELVLASASSILLVSSHQIRIMLISLFGTAKTVTIDLNDPTSIEMAVAIARSKRFMIRYNPIVCYIDL